MRYVLPSTRTMVESRCMTNRREILLAAGAAGMLAGGEAGETKPAAHPKDSPLDSEKFRQAVVAGDVPAVTSMLDRDPALRYARNADGVSVYTLACLKGQPKVAEELARRGLVLDSFEAAVTGNSKRAAELAKDDPGVAHHRLPDGRTPLHLATEAGKQDMVIFFAMKGADLSAAPESPLLAAVDHPDRATAAEMSWFLLMNASDPNARRRDGKSALHLAAVRGYEDLTELLIHRGAKADVQDAAGKSPLDVATGDAIAVLQRASSIERVYFERRYTQDVHGNPTTRADTPGIPQELINQFVTVAHFDFEKVKQLQKLCPTLVMARATWDELAIEAAAHMGLTTMAEFLADLGAPVSTCTATLLGAQSLVKRLVTEDPACLRERGAHDIGLLAYTAYGNQQVEIAEFLLGAGADLHSRSLGQTALHIAANKGHLELARLFLDHGADVNAVAKVRGASLTPLAFAVQAKHEKMEELLRERGGRA
jgi:ankyrin repeat protein